MKNLILITGIFLAAIQTLHAQVPVWDWAKSSGSASSDAATDMVKDSAGNIFVTGYFGQGSASFGVITFNGTGIQNLFIAKYDALGNCAWAIKADGFIYPTGISITASGDIYITGSLNGLNSFGAITVTSTGIYDVFIAKCNSAGVWQWVLTAGGSGTGSQNYGNGIVTDAKGNSYITGIIADTISFGATTLISKGMDDVFIAKTDSGGNWLWVKQFGATDNDDGNKITMDAAGDIYFTGCFRDTVAFGATTLISAGFEDAFVCKADTSGTSLWAYRAGGSTPDIANAVMVDAAGNIFVTGWYSTTAFFGTNNVTTTGGNEVFVAKCSQGGTWQWVASGGTPGIDIAHDIAIDVNGNSYITGYVNAGYPVIFGNDTIQIPSDYSDIFTAKCNSAGSWNWLLVNGSTSWDVGYAILADTCTAYVAGYYSLGVDFGSTLLTAAGTTSDVFTGKINYCSEQPNLIESWSGYKHGLKIFPNPGSDVITLMPGDKNDAQIIISEVSGKIVFQTSVKINMPLNIDISHLKAGFYFVRHGSDVVKLVKE